MKKFIVFALIISSAICTQGQGLYVTQNSKALDLLKQNGITVVIPDNKFGELLKKTVTEHWTATKYEFINQQDISKFENKKEINLLGYFHGEFESGKHYLYNVPFIGVTNKYIAEKDYKVRDKDTYAYILYAGDGVAEENLEVTLLLYIKTLNNLINIGGAKEWMAEIKKTGKDVKKKKIYVLEDDLEASIADIKKKYTGSVKKVDRVTYNNAILNNEDVNIFLDVRTSTCFLFAVISKDGFAHYTMFASTMNLTKAYQLALFKALGKL